MTISIRFWNNYNNIDYPDLVKKTLFHFVTYLSMETPIPLTILVAIANQVYLFLQKAVSPPLLLLTQSYHLLRKARRLVHWLLVGLFPRPGKSSKCALLRFLGNKTNKPWYQEKSVNGVDKILIPYLQGAEWVLELFLWLFFLQFWETGPDCLVSRRPNGNNDNGKYY